MARHRDELGRRIALLLLGGIVLGFSGSPRRFSVTLRALRREWRRYSEDELQRAIRNLYRSKLVDYREGPDGTATVILTDAGRQRALTYQLDELVVRKPARWDGKWRLVFFDIPERQRKGRDAFRERLRQIGFREIQRSVFVHAFECKDEIDFLIEFYQLRPWVRYALVDTIDTELHLKQRFGV